jgi:hypothetical protein
MVLFHSNKVYQPKFYATIFDQPWLDGAKIDKDGKTTGAK